MGSPALFIPAAILRMLSEQYRDDLLAQFPQARAHVIAGAGHWVHAENRMRYYALSVAISMINATD